MSFVEVLALRLLGKQHRQDDLYSKPQLWRHDVEDADTRNTSYVTFHISVPDSYSIRSEDDLAV